MEIDKKAYAKYVKTVTPVHSLSKDMGWAFVVGGTICALGEGFNQILQAFWGIEEKEAAVWAMIGLIAVSAVLTGCNIYQKLVKVAGAGALVPITGFANSIAAPAVEFHAEGEVFGVGVKIFTIAGPVILYGTLASWVLGLVWWLGQRLL